MTQPQTRVARVPTTTLEEIMRQLVAIHYPLATNLDGGRDLQTRTRQRVETLMATVEAAMQAEQAGRGSSS